MVVNDWNLATGNGRGLHVTWPLWQELGVVQDDHYNIPFPHDCRVFVLDFLFM